MSSVDFYSIKSGDLSPLCCFPIFLYDSHDLIFRKWTRNLSTGFGRNIRSGYRLHICSCRLCGSSCVIDLDTDTCTMLVNRLCQFEKTRQVIIVVDTELSGSVRTFRRIDAGIFYHNKSYTAFGSLFIIINMEETHFSTGFSVVRSHWSHHDTVLHCHTANCKRFKDMLILFFHN